MSVKLVSDAQALQSMRASDFDACSAYGEVVDNSIEAGASEIRIHFDYQSGKGRAAPLQSVAFADNGHGMEPAVLQRCLQLGYSSRFNSRTGIGRFGVGATLGAINQCKRIDVYSRTLVSPWHRVSIDLQDIEEGRQDGIAPPLLEPPPASLGDLVPSQSGTVVIWRKHDKQDAPADRLVSDFVVWAGRTYRRFIWDGLKLYINGTLVPAIDPLYARVDGTAFPADPIAKEYSIISLPWPVPSSIDPMLGNVPETSNVEIRMSLLPERFRATQGSGNSSDARARHIPMNEGVSIMRNNREVFYGHIPWWPGSPFKEIDRWWGAEISFEAVLDYSFSVKNIKRGAVPLTELKKALADKIEPTRKTALESVRTLWEESRITEQTEGKNRRHAEAEQAAKQGDGQLPRGELPGPVDQASVDQFTQDFLKAKTAEEQARWRELFRSQPFTIEDARWKGADFLEIKHLGGNDVLLYNSTHRFHGILSDLEGGLGNGDASDPARILRSLIDLLLISYAKAETMFPEDQGTLEQLRMYWGNFLQQYIQSWRGSPSD